MYQNKIKYHIIIKGCVLKCVVVSDLQIYINRINVMS